jgi:TolB protein
VTLNIKGTFVLASFRLSSKKLSLLTTPDHSSEAPVFSPDGREVMFSSNRDGGYELYSMSPTGSNQTRLTANDVDEHSPCYTATPGVILTAKKGGIYQLTLATKKEVALSFRGDYAPGWTTR